MDISQPRWNADGTIDCIVHHERFGEIPFTARSDSSEPQTQEIWQALQARDDIAPYVGPTDEELRAGWRASAFLSRMEFVLACKRAGILSTDEAIEAAKGDWPASFADALADPDVGMDPDEAQIIWAAASQVERLHPLIAAVQTHRDMTDDEVDALFGYAPAS